MLYTYTETPIGAVLLAGLAGQLHYIGFPNGPKAMAPEPGWQPADAAAVSQPPFIQAKSQLEEYFAGQRQEFDLPLAPKGTEFQLAVWQALRQIPYGATCTYRDIAQEVGNVKAVRAVGAANGRNPLPIVVPCHRVIGSNGKLTGFGGGLDTKAFLLGLEADNLGLFAS